MNIVPGIHEGMLLNIYNFEYKKTTKVWYVQLTQ
jgi:hypothetical protein